MADLAQGYHANVVLQPSEALRVEADGTTTVQALYGAPDGTTTLTNQSQTFGPYGVPAKLKVQATAGSATYGLFEPPTSSTGYLGDQVFVLASDSAATVKAKLETLNPSLPGETDSPVNRGRMIELPTGYVDTGGPVLLSTMQGMRGTKGSTWTLYNPAHSPPGAGESGHIILADDSLSNKGIRGNAPLENLEFHGNRQSWEATYPTAIVHGYHAPDRPSGKCIAHAMRNTTFSNYTGGVYIGSGNDQLRAEMFRVENCGKTIGGLIDDPVHHFALTLKSSDCKLSKLGIHGPAGAVKVSGAAPEIDTVDFYTPEDFKGECTLLLENAGRTQIKGGTVSGRTIVRGRNNQGTGVRYEAAAIILADLTFKHDQILADSFFYQDGSGAGGIGARYFYDSYLDVGDTDIIDLRAPKFGFDPSLPTSSLPDFLIKITTTTGNRARLGLVNISGGSRMIGLAGRPGDANNIFERLGCKKHWSNEPHLTVFDWGVPGQPLIVPKWMVNHPDPTRRLYIPFDGVERAKAHFQFAYLAFTINPGGTHGTLDDPNVNFTLPVLPDISEFYCYAMRATL